MAAQLDDPVAEIERLRRRISEFGQHITQGQRLTKTASAWARIEDRQLEQVLARCHSDDACTDSIQYLKVQEQLRRSEAFLAEAQRLTLTGSFAWHPDTDEVTGSAELYRIFGFDPNGKLTTEMISSRVHPEDVNLLTKMRMAHQTCAGLEDFDCEYRLLMPDQSIKYLHVIAHACPRGHDQIEYIAAVQDVTERHMSEEALAGAREELAKVSSAMSLGVLTASIAHEVNQPLTGIVTNASTCLRMLDADPPNVDGARETVRRVLRDGNRAAELIARLRALFSKMPPATTSLDLNEAIEEVIALSSIELQRGRAVLRTEFADALPPVRGDRIQLQQVLSNLLRNAIDAMSDVADRPRQLVIRTAPGADDRVTASVQDSGVGLNPAKTDRLFQPFHTTKPSGMGIGLSVSRSIIENHGGCLWATPNDGPGATFSFSIPRGCSPP